MYRIITWSLSLILLILILCYRMYRRKLDKRQLEWNYVIAEICDVCIK